MQYIIPFFYFTQECLQYLATYKLKEKAAGKAMVMLPLILYRDDTSGNKSNQFYSWSVLLAGLPQKVNSQLTNIHFLCCLAKVHVHVYVYFTVKIFSIIFLGHCIGAGRAISTPIAGVRDYGGRSL